MKYNQTILSAAIGSMLRKSGAKAESDPEQRTPLNFQCSDVDKALIEKLTQRGVREAKSFGVELDYMLLQMDITTVHCNGTPLKLLQFLMSDVNDFSNDLKLIGLGVNRTTGKMHPDALRGLIFRENVQ